MKGREYARAGFARGASATGGLFVAIVVVLLCAGFSQPELDDRHPGVKASVATGKLSRLEKSPYELDEIRRQRGVLVLGNFLLTSVFHHAFVRFDRKQNLRIWPVVTVGFERSPPVLT